MAKQLSKKTIFCLICTFVYGVPSDTADINAATNGEVTLKVEMEGEKTEVLWKHKGSKMVEWEKSTAALVEYLRFQGRTVFDKTTGDVTILNLSKNDSGKYEAEVLIQEKIQSRIHTVKVYDPVTEAKITCNNTGSMATLHCEAKGDLLSYSWPGDGLQSAEIQGQTRPQISKEKDQNSVYTCVVSNPVSKTSVNYHGKDCFSSGNVWLIVGGVVGGVALLACCIAGYIWRQRKQQKSSSSIPGKEPLLKQGISHHPPTQPPEAQRALINSPNTKVMPTDQNLSGNMVPDTSLEAPSEPIVQKGLVNERKKVFEKRKPWNSGEASKSLHGEQNLKKEEEDRSGGIHQDKSTPTPEAQHTLENTSNTVNNNVSNEERFPGMSGNPDEAFNNTVGEKNEEMEGGEGSDEVKQDPPAEPLDTQHTPDKSSNTAIMGSGEVKRDPASKSTDITHDSNSETASSPTCLQDDQKTKENFGSSNIVADEENHSDTKESTQPLKSAQVGSQPSLDPKKNSDHDCTDYRVSSPDQPPDKQETEESLLENAAHTDEANKNTHGGQNVEMKGGEHLSKTQKNAQDTQQHTPDESNEVYTQSGPKKGLVQQRREDIERGKFGRAESDEALESTHGNQNMEMEEGDESGGIHQNTPTEPLQAHHTLNNSHNAANNGLTNNKSCLNIDQDSIAKADSLPTHAHDEHKTSEGEKTKGEENHSDNE